jgi:hypothetical protein
MVEFKTPFQLHLSIIIVQYINYYQKYYFPVSLLRLDYSGVMIIQLTLILVRIILIFLRLKNSNIACIQVNIRNGLECINGSVNGGMKCTVFIIQSGNPLQVV